MSSIRGIGNATPLHHVSGYCMRLASIRDSGMRITKPTTATTTTMTTTFGSLKLWLPTTSEAAMLRCAVPKARTRRVSVVGPPSHHPTAKATAIKRRPARMPPVPNTASTFLMFVTTRRSTKAMRLRLEMRLSSGLVRAARDGKRALTASATASGTSIRKNNERAIFVGLTETPGRNAGNTSGR
jgi:hypothetical protein